MKRNPNNYLFKMVALDEYTWGFQLVHRASGKVYFTAKTESECKDYFFQVLCA